MGRTASLATRYPLAGQHDQSGPQSRKRVVGHRRRRKV